MVLDRDRRRAAHRSVLDVIELTVMRLSDAVFGSPIIILNRTRRTFALSVRLRLQTNGQIPKPEGNQGIMRRRD